MINLGTSGCFASDEGGRGRGDVALGGDGGGGKCLEGGCGVGGGVDESSSSSITSSISSTSSTFFDLTGMTEGTITLPVVEMPPSFNVSFGTTCDDKYK